MARFLKQIKNLCPGDRQNNLGQSYVNIGICNNVSGIPVKMSWQMAESLRQNPSGNWVISIFSGQKPCTRRI